MNKTVLHFVQRVMEDINCEKAKINPQNCGIQNDGGKLNKFPWFVAIKENIKRENVQDYNYNNFYPGTLVSKHYVLTAASILEGSEHTDNGRGQQIDEKNFQALVGATAYELNIANANPEGILSSISNIFKV